jgi:hypothetical protein
VAEEQSQILKKTILVNNGLFGFRSFSVSIKKISKASKA